MGAPQNPQPVPLSGRRKLLHQPLEGKEVTQEENFLPKHQRVKDLCQRSEYQTPCQQRGQVTPPLLHSSIRAVCAFLYLPFL